MIPGEIENTGKSDLIIPFGWWNKEHPLTNIANTAKCVFEEAKCHAYVGDEALADLFEWDETVGYDEEAQ